TVLEPVDDGPGEELDLTDGAGHRSDSNNMSAPHTPAPKGYHSSAPPAAAMRPGGRGAAKTRSPSTQRTSPPSRRATARGAASSTWPEGRARKLNQGRSGRTQEAGR